MLRVDDLTHHYGPLTALDAVSFEVQAHERVALLGLNGAGKSTLIRVIAGLLEPARGTVTLAGRAPGSPEHRRAIGYLPDVPPLYDELRVAEFLRWCGRIRGRTHAEVERELGEVLALCRLESVAQRPIGALSFGFRKRVGLAQALIHRPELVLLDEPIGGLDPVQIVEIRQVVRDVAARATVIVSSHILAEVAQTCDRALVLHEGRLVAEGTPDELQAQAQARCRLALTVRLGAVAPAELEAVVRRLDAQAALHWGAASPAAAEPLSSLVVELDGSRREALVAALVGAGIGIHAVADAHADLERGFLALVAGPAAAPPALEVAS